ARNAYYIGSHIGMAFQILDDILDYTQTADGLGKPVLEDVKQGVYTAPLLFAMQKDADSFIPLLSKREQMTDEDTRKVQQLVVALSRMEKAQHLAEKYTEKAMRRINRLPDKSEKETLRKLTLQLLNRNL